MASAAQIISLVRSHTRGDSSRFEQVALQLAAQEAKRGHNKVAEELRVLVEEARNQSASIERTRDPIPMVRPRGELAGILTASFPSIRLSSLVLPERLEEGLNRILKEQRQRDKLEDHAQRATRNGKNQHGGRARWRIIAAAVHDRTRRHYHEIHGRERGEAPACV
jgi:hypothetical protein